MNKKGFTLIELLAVIVILAIIAVIAIPIVLNIISDLRKDSTEICMKNIEKAASLYYQENYNEENIVFECSKDKCKYNNKELELNGKSPENGKILIDKKGNITYEDIVLNGFNCYKEHEKFVCDTKKIRKTYNESEIVINSDKEYNLFDYNIYGNSVEKENNIQDKILPSDYQAVEYINGIQSSKNPAITSINLNLMWKDVSKINLKMQFLTLSADNHGSMIFKTTTNGSDGVSPFIFSQTNGIKFSGINGSVTKDYTKEQLTNNGLKELEILINANTISSNMYFGAWCDTAYSKDWQLEYLKIYDTKDKLIRNLIPCYRKLDGIIGMYDLVSDVFYTNSGNGTFVKGNDIANTKILSKFESVGDESKNLFNEELLLSNSNVTKVEDGYKIAAYPAQYVSSTSLVTHLKSILKPNVTYTLSRKANISINSSGAILIKNSSGNLVSLSFGMNSKITFSLTQEQIDSINQVWLYGSKDGSVIYNYIQLEEGSESTDYTPYEKYKIYGKVNGGIINIYLDEPLRSLGEKADYIDFKNSKVVRYIEEDNLGDLKVLSVPKEEKMELPEILLKEGINSIEINTKIKPSKVELEYYK